jgi:fatty acid amide hydrolase
MAEAARPQKTAAEVAADVRAARTSAAEVVEAAIARSEAVQPRLNAVAVPRYEEAAAAARRLDEAGSPRLPLAGVPVTVKESFDLAGTPSSGGVEALARTCATGNAALVDALHAAGAIIIAKGNLAQLLWFAETDNPVYGRTSNPHALDRSPGGSSGGDAALVAAGVVPVAVGTDLGGSVRQPAHCCGIAALKPTAGRLSLAGTLDERLFASFPWIANQPGIFARDTADLTLVLAVLGGPVQPAPPDGLRVGVIETNGIAEPHPDVRRAVEIAADAAGQAGARLVPFPPPAAEDAVDLFDAVFGSDGGESLERALAGTPAHPRIAASIAAARGRALGPEAAAILDADIAAYRRSFAAALDRERLDAVLGPAYPVPAVPHGTSEQHVRGQSYTSLWNLLGYPAGVVPATATADGLPIGVQVAARPWREDVVLGLLAAISAAKPPSRTIADR